MSRGSGGLIGAPADAVAAANVADATAGLHCSVSVCTVRPRAAAGAVYSLPWVSQCPKPKGS